MKAQFTIEINLGRKPEAGLLRLLEFPQVESWGELTEKQQKRYAKLWMFENGNDLNEDLANGSDNRITLIP